MTQTSQNSLKRSGLQCHMVQGSNPERAKNNRADIRHRHLKKMRQKQKQKRTSKCGTNTGAAGATVGIVVVVVVVVAAAALKHVCASWWFFDLFCFSHGELTVLVFDRPICWHWQCHILSLHHILTQLHRCASSARHNACLIYLFLYQSQTFFYLSVIQYINIMSAGLTDFILYLKSILPISIRMFLCRHAITNEFQLKDWPTMVIENISNQFLFILSYK